MFKAVQSTCEQTTNRPTFENVQSAVYLWSVTEAGTPDPSTVVELPTARET